MGDDGWLSERGRDGGIDEVPLPEGPGRLFLCAKHVVGPGPDAALRRAGASTVVCLNDRHELADRYPAYVDWLSGEGANRSVWHPVPDLHAPPVAAAVVLLDDLRSRIRRGEDLLVHCGAGIGRAGTIAAGLLVRMGTSLDDAVATVARSRPLAGPEAGPQRMLLDELAALGSP